MVVAVLRVGGGDLVHSDTLCKSQIRACTFFPSDNGRGKDQLQVRVATKTQSASSRAMQSCLTQTLAQPPPQHLPAGHERPTGTQPAEAVRQFGRLTEESPLTGHEPKRLHDRGKLH